MKEFLAGADEAGRGCVLGPMVMCAFALPVELEPQLKPMGVKDSKLLVHPVRVKLEQELTRMGTAVLEVISAEEITLAMRKNTSLNELEAKRLAQGLKTLWLQAPFSKVFIDSPDPVPDKFEKRVRKYGDFEFQIVSRNKADRDYPVVGAASIFAKVRRENEVAKIKGELAAQGITDDFGSGYSHDPLTIAFLAKHHRQPALQMHIRHEWETAKRLKTEQVDLGRFL
jgi:ribonuclease HII